MQTAGQAHPAYFAYHLLWCGVDWVFPPICGGCEQPGERWCSACEEKVLSVPHNLCPRCGQPQNTPDLCSDCQTQPPVYEELRSWGIYEGTLRKAIHRLKYQGDIGLGEALSKHLIELYNHLRWNVDLIVPVPLSIKRRKNWGYNQAGLLALPLALATGKTYHSRVLKRTRETQSQVGLNARERQKNVQSAFQACPDQVRGKTVLVIDDVSTTGSTIYACAQALTSAGASAVYGMTLRQSRFAGGCR